MTLPVSPNSIAVSQVNSEIARPAEAQADLQWLNGYIKPSIRPAQPNLQSFYGLAYFARTVDGNCNNASAGNCNCNCGNIQCNNCANCTAINCVNCESTPTLQANCNCACTYNCTSDQNCYSYNCNCSKIICTKLHEIGLMPNHIFVADQQFGEHLKKTDPEVYEGYVRWASVIVSGMEGKAQDFMFWVKKQDRKQAEKEATIKWANRVAKPWSEHMAYLMGVLPQDNNVGRIIMKLGKPLSRFVGKLPQNYKFGIFGTYALWLVCPSLYYTAICVDKVQSLFKSKTSGVLA